MDLELSEQEFPETNRNLAGVAARGFLSRPEARHPARPVAGETLLDNTVGELR